MSSDMVFQNPLLQLAVLSPGQNSSLWTPTGQLNPGVAAPSHPGIAPNFQSLPPMQMSQPPSHHASPHGSVQQDNRPRFHFSSPSVPRGGYAVYSTPGSNVPYPPAMPSPFGAPSQYLHILVPPQLPIYSSAAPYGSSSQFPVAPSPYGQQVVLSMGVPMLAGAKPGENSPVLTAAEPLPTEVVEDGVN
jgi:hypothetical protein